MNRLVILALVLAGCPLWDGIAGGNTNLNTDNLLSHAGQQTICWRRGDPDAPHELRRVTVRNLSSSETYVLEEGDPSEILDVVELEGGGTVSVPPGETREITVRAQRYFASEATVVVPVRLPDGENETEPRYETIRWTFTNSCPQAPGPGGGQATKVHPDPLDLELAFVVPRGFADVNPGRSTIFLAGHGSNGGSVQVRDAESGDLVSNTPITPGFGLGAVFEAVPFEDAAAPPDQQTYFLTYDLKVSRFNGGWGQGQFVPRVADINVVAFGPNGLATEAFTANPTNRLIGHILPGATRTEVFSFQFRAGERPVTVAPDDNDDLYFATLADADDSSRLYCMEPGGEPQLVHELGLGVTRARRAGPTLVTAQNGSQTLCIFARGPSGKFEAMRPVGAGAVLTISVYFNGVNTVVIWANGPEMGFLLVSPAGDILFDERRPPPSGVEAAIHLIYDRAGGLVGTGTAVAGSAWFTIADYINTLGLPAAFRGPS